VKSLVVVGVLAAGAYAALKSERGQELLERLNEKAGEFVAKVEEERGEQAERVEEALRAATDKAVARLASQLGIDPEVLRAQMRQQTGAEDA
jgi:hypothetical protein